jgi:hypothetical protein
MAILEAFRIGAVVVSKGVDKVREQKINLPAEANQSFGHSLF